MVLWHPDGTYTRATNVEQIDAACANGAVAIEIYTQAPNVAAFTDLMNRALDKPAEQVRVTRSDDGPIEIVFRWLLPTDTRATTIEAESRSDDDEPSKRLPRKR